MKKPVWLLLLAKGGRLKPGPEYVYYDYVRDMYCTVLEDDEMWY